MNPEVATVVAPPSRWAELERTDGQSERPRDAGAAGKVAGKVPALQLSNRVRHGAQWCDPSIPRSVIIVAAYGADPR